MQSRVSNSLDGYNAPNNDHRSGEVAAPITMLVMFVQLAADGPHLGESIIKFEELAEPAQSEE